MIRRSLALATRPGNGGPPSLVLNSQSFRFDLCGLGPFLGMALLDFYQLAVLHNLSRADPGFPSTHSRPLCMAGTSPPRSPSPSAEPDEIYSPVSPAVQSQPKTPERNRSAVRLVSEVTPLSRGSSMRQKHVIPPSRTTSTGRMLSMFSKSNHMVTPSVMERRSLG